MKRVLNALTLLPLVLTPAIAQSQTQNQTQSQTPATRTPGAATTTYPPIADYLMPRETEIAMARSAAPAVIADRATVKVLTTTGYEVASQGDNGAVCLVMRGFSGPTYTPAAFRGL